MSPIAIARNAAGQPVDLESAIAELIEIDSKTDLAWALAYLAERESDPDRARRFATDALAAADAVGRDSDAVIARCILGLPAKASRDITARARRLLKERKHGHTRARANV